MFRSSLLASHGHGRTISARLAARRKQAADRLKLAASSVEALERRQLLSASPSFTPPQDFSTREVAAPFAMVVADVNGDGKPDIVTLNNYGDVSVLIGNGNGTFQKAQTVYDGVSNSSGGIDAQSLAVGSYNNKEYIFASNYNSDTVSVLSANSAGVWSVYGTFSSQTNGSSHINALTVANINGTPFLVTANQDGSVSYSQIEAGSSSEGFFGPQHSITSVITSGVNGATTSALVSLATGNFIGGGNGADLIVVGSNHKAAVLAGTNVDGASSTSGGFEGPTKVSLDTTTVTGITNAAAVYNGGSGNALVKTTSNSVVSLYSISSTPANPFGTGGTFSPGLGAGQVAVGDFNGDGHTDFMFVSHSGGTNTIALYTSDGGGSGGYNSGGTFSKTGGYSYSAAAGDFKGDGEASLAVGYYNSGSSDDGFVGVSENSTPLAPSFNSVASGGEDVTVGAGFSLTITTQGVAAPKITETGALPPGLNFKDNGDGTATISGKAGSTSDKTFTLHLTAKNATDTATETLTLDINQLAKFTSPNTVTFTEGTAGTFKVKTTGGFTDGGFSTLAAVLVDSSGHSISGGSSFDGLTLVDNGDGTATLSGTPTATGKVDIIVSSGSGTLLVQQDIKLSLVAKPTFGSNTSADFKVGIVDTTKPSDLDEEITTTGFPAANISISSGSLPSGLTFKNNGDGTADIFGTPSKGTGGKYVIKLVASNSAGPATNEPFTYTVHVAEQPVITSAASTTFTVGKTGTKFTVTAKGNTGLGGPSFSHAVDALNGIVGGSLPTGLTFTANADGTATISGTPAAGTGGIYTLTIATATDADDDLFTDSGLVAATQTFTLRVNEAPAFASASASKTVLAGSAITPFVISTSAGFGSPSLTKSGAFPKGLTFTDNGNGTATISGTPTATSGGIYKFNVDAKNAAGSATQKYTLQVDQAPEFTGSLTSKTVDATHGKAINRSAPLQGFDTPFGDLTNVGSGLTQNGMTIALNSAGTALTLTGTPASAGTTTFQVTVDDHDGDAGPTLTVTVDVA